MQRNSLHYLIYTVLVICIGLLSRTSVTPAFIYPYLGDALYAVMCFFGFGMLFRKISSLKLMLLALLFCFSIETLQLYQADWITTVRSYRIGALVLGHGFLWSDMLCYIVGVGVAYLIEVKFIHVIH